MPPSVPHSPERISAALLILMRWACNIVDSSKVGQCVSYFYQLSSVYSCWEAETSLESPALPVSPASPASRISLADVTMLTECQYKHCIDRCSCSPREGTVVTREGFTLYWTTCGPDNVLCRSNGVNNGPYSTLADKTAVYATAVDSPSRAGRRLHELTHMPRAFGMENSSLVCKGSVRILGRKDRRHRIALSIFGAAQANTITSPIATTTEP